MWILSCAIWAFNTFMIYPLYFSLFALFVPMQIISPRWKLQGICVKSHTIIVGCGGRMPGARYGQWAHFGNVQCLQFSSETTFSSHSVWVEPSNESGSSGSSVARPLSPSITPMSTRSLILQRTYFSRLSFGRMKEFPRRSFSYEEMMQIYTIFSLREIQIAGWPCYGRIEEVPTLPFKKEVVCQGGLADDQSLLYVIRHSSFP